MQFNCYDLKDNFPNKKDYNICYSKSDFGKQQFYYYYLDTKVNIWFLHFTINFKKADIFEKNYTEKNKLIESVNNLLNSV